MGIRKKKRMFPGAWNYVKEITSKLNECVKTAPVSEVITSFYLPKESSIYDAIRDNIEIVGKRIHNECPYVKEMTLDKKGFNGCPSIKIKIDEEIASEMQK